MTIASTLHGALDAIRTAIPGCVGLEVRRFDTWSLLSMRVEHDDELRAVATALDLGSVEEIEAAGLRWRRARRYFDAGLAVEVTGPRDSAPAPQVDQSTLDAAFDRARAAALELGAQLGQDVGELAVQLGGSP